MGIQESLTEFYQKLEEGWYSFCDNLKDSGIPIYDYFVTPIESKGIPSLPVAILLVLLLIGGLAFLLTMNQTATLSVMVQSEEGPVDGAAITVVVGELTQRASTSGGNASFKDLPKGKTATIRVKKEGFKDESRDFQIGSKPTLTITMSSEGNIEFEVQVLDFQGVALEGAEIKYTYSDKSGNEVSETTSTDASGKAKLNAPDKSQVTAIVSLAGYESQTKPITAEKGGLTRIILQKIEVSVTPPDGDHAQLEIQVKDDSDDSAIDAALSIYDQYTQELLKEGRTASGIFRSSDLKIGSQIKVVAKAAGYEDAIKPKTLVAKTILPIRMRKLKIDASPRPPTNDSIISVYDEKASPLPSEIRLWEYSDEANYTLLKKAVGSTELRYPLSADKAHYATAFKDAYLPGRTPTFLGAQSSNITLIKANSSNSVNLTITVIDEDGKRVSAATIAFFDDLGDQVAPFDLKTDSTGKLKLKYFPIGVFRVLASKPPLYGDAIVDTAASTDINITIASPKGTVEISALDWDSNETVDEFSVNVSLAGDANGSVFARCETLNGNCLMELRAGRDLKFDVGSAMYERATATLKPIPNSVKQLQVRLMRIGSSSITRIAFDRLTDINYNITEPLYSGGYYVAIFDVYGKAGIPTQGVFLRLEGGSGEEMAHIVNYSWEGSAAIKAVGSANLKRTNVCAISFDSELNAPKPLSWIDAQYEFSGSSKVSYLIKIDTATSAKQLMLKFRSYAASGGEYFRDPEDAELGSNFETANKEWCTAQTKNASFAVESCGNLEEVCCIGRASSDGGACNSNYQCQMGDDNSSGICNNPTVCGTYGRYCTDQTVCCATGGAKSCVSGAICPDDKNRECDPPCGPEEFCDSTGPASEKGICKPVGSLCGKESMQCCAEGMKCEIGLKCSSTNKCMQCGGLGQICCAETSGGVQPPCKEDYQCGASIGGSICRLPPVCGPSKIKCSGDTVCCNEPSKRGQCIEESKCTAPVKCPDCMTGQYCDATNPDAPICKDCTLNPSACKFGGIGELCSLTNASLRCRQGTCVPLSGSSLGICTLCGAETQQCCPDSICNANLSCSDEGRCISCGNAGQSCCNSGPECVQPDTLCSSSSNTCTFGNKDCAESGCISVEFSQQQCESGGQNCALKKGTNAFVAHSLKSCGLNCKEGNLTLSYEIDNLAGEYPGTLTFQISDINSLRPLSLLSGGNRRIPLDSDSGTINVPVSDSSWLDGKLTLAPLNKNPRVIISATFRQGLAAPVTLRPFVSVVESGSARPPKFLPNIFSCEKLVLNATRYPGTSKPVLEASCDKIIFQADSIFPADAIPLDDSGMAACGTWDIKFGTPADATKYSSCFDYSSSPGGKALRYWPTKSLACPLAPVGNTVPTADVTAVVRCLQTEENKTIQIKITNYALSDVNAIDISPINYKSSSMPEPVLPGSFYFFNSEDFSPLRLVYALNNRVRAADRNAFNRRDTLWAGEYTGSAGSYTRASSSSMLIWNGEELPANLIAWDTSQKASMKIYSADDSRRLTNMPPLVGTLSSIKPLATSLEQKLTSKALAKINANSFDASQYAKALFAEFTSTAREVAAKTAFKRSFENKFYCVKEEPTVEDTLNPAVCRGSPNAWVTVRKNVEATQEACEMCNDVYGHSYGTPASGNDNFDTCDIRCQPDDQCSTGYCASVNPGESYVNSTGQTNNCPDEDDDSNTDDGYACAYACNAKSTKQGDYCGGAELCGSCGPSGIKYGEAITSYDYVWENASRLFEVTIPLGAEAQDAKLPYKYFVSNPESTPFTFSAVLPLTADIVYNRLNQPPLFNVNDENLVDFSAGSLPHECKVRTGIYLLSTQTSNGLDFYSDSADSGKFIKLQSLTVSENYPESQGAGQDYCGNVPACNLFDPYEVESLKPSMKKWINTTKYFSRCFTWEWPVIPDTMKITDSEDQVWLGLIPYGGTKTDFNRYIKESRSVFSAQFITVLVIGVAAAITGGALGFAYLGLLTPASAIAIGAGIGLGAGLAVGAGTTELIIDEHPKKWVYRDPNFYSFPVSQQLASKLGSSYLLGMIYYSGGKSCLGCDNVPWTVHAYAVPPYDISKYPNVFGTEWKYAHGKVSLDADNIETVTLDDFGGNTLTFNICGKDVGEAECYE